MGQLFRHQLWIVLAASVVFFTNLGAVRLFDKDETLYASCAREMLQRGDWVVPVFNGELFPDKPPLMYWLMISGYSLFGVTEFAARFWSAAFVARRARAGRLAVLVRSVRVPRSPAAPVGRAVVVVVGAPVAVRAFAARLG